MITNANIYTEGFNARVNGDSYKSSYRKRVDRADWQMGFEDANTLFNHAVAKCIETHTAPVYPISITADGAQATHEHSNAVYAQIKRELYGE